MGSPIKKTTPMVKEKLSANAAKQGRVLRFIEDKLGRFATNPRNIPGGRLEPILKDTLREFFNRREGCTNTLRRRYRHYLKFCEAPKATKYRNKRKNNERQAIRKAWSDEDLRILKNIVYC